MPPLRLARTGYGAGTRDIGVANLLRVITGEAMDFPGEQEQLAYVVSTNIDDMNPEFYDYVMERLFGAGAHDVWLAPIQMKKTRPGTTINVLCSPSDATSIKRILLEETSTFGLRTASVMISSAKPRSLFFASSWRWRRAGARCA